MNVLRSFAACAAILVITLFPLGCTDDPPNAVGSDLLPSKDQLKIDSLSFAAVASSDSLTKLAGNSGRILLGRSQGIESRVLMQFSIGSSDFPSARIDSAVLTLNLEYRFKDTVGTLGFVIRNIDSGWNASTFTWDSLSTRNISDTVIASYPDRQSALSDTRLTLRLDTLMVRKWITRGLASFILLPTVNTTIVTGIQNVITTDSTLPRLSVTYHDTLDSLHTLNGGYSQASYVATGPTPPADGHIYLQGGLAYRGRVNFDVSQIPTRATISEAVLELHYDASASLTGRPHIDSVLAQINLANGRDSLGGYSSIGAFTDTSHRVMSFRINNMVQQWVSHRLPNYGTALRLYAEYSAFDRFAFYGAGASADSLKPRLRIRYSIVP
jgi:hypothetical protein